jgi:uncharacterized protein
MHSIQRYFYVGLLAIVVAVAGVVFFYRTSAPVVETKPDAEFGGVSLKVDYATTSEAKEHGLGGRTEMPEDYGMLFAFPVDDYYGFWMKDAMVPLDIFWLDAQGQTVFIMADVATSTYPDVFYPTTPARYVLETAAGFARKHNIVIGTPLLLKNFPSVSQ